MAESDAKLDIHTSLCIGGSALPTPVLPTYFTETVEMDCDSLTTDEKTAKTARASL